MDDNELAAWLAKIGIYCGMLDDAINIGDCDYILETDCWPLALRIYTYKVWLGYPDVEYSVSGLGRFYEESKLR